MGQTPIPISSNTRCKTCGQVLSSDCVTVPVDLPGLNLCGVFDLTDVLVALNNGAGNQVITGLNLGCLYSGTVGVCPAGWTFVPGSVAGTGTCSNGCPAGSIPGGIDPTTGQLICVFCSSISPCPPPSPSWEPNPTPPPVTIKDVLQLIINAIPCCNPCNQNTVNATTTTGCPPGQIC